MPRRIYQRKKPLTTQERQQRARSYRAQRSDAWVDPFPNVQGTLPEKVVFAELMARQVPFIFQSWFRAEIPVVGFDRWYRPDFIIPDAKVIIEVQGFFFHSDPEQIKSDAFKYAIYEHLGYKVLTWWDFDILSDLQLLFASEPLLRRYAGRGGRVFTGNEEYGDDAAGVRAANISRTDYGKRRARYKTNARRKGLYSYVAG